MTEKIKKPGYALYRVCYRNRDPKIRWQNGNLKTREKIYEFHKYCDCEDCRYRRDRKREPSNQAYIYMMDISKEDIAVEYLKNWKCKDGTRRLKNEVIYYNCQK